MSEPWQKRIFELTGKMPLAKDKLEVAAQTVAEAWLGAPLLGRADRERREWYIARTDDPKKPVIISPEEKGLVSFSLASAQTTAPGKALNGETIARFFGCLSLSFGGLLPQPLAPAPPAPAPPKPPTHAPPPSPPTKGAYLVGPGFMTTCMLPGAAGGRNAIAPLFTAIPNLPPINIFDYTCMLIPIYDEDLKHWTLLFLNFLLRTMCYIDSKKHAKNDAPKLRARVLLESTKYLADEYAVQFPGKSPPVWTECKQPDTLPLQGTSSNDCGVFVCAFGEALARGKLPADLVHVASKEDVDMWRLRIFTVNLMGFGGMGK